jgi:hypothetical protein
VRIGDPATLAIDPIACATRWPRRPPSRRRGMGGRRRLRGGSAAAVDRAAGLPLLGMGERTVRALRDPQRFFATLDRLGLAHPPVPSRRRRHRGLARQARGRQRRAGTSVPPQACGREPDTYYQRHQAGTPDVGPVPRRRPRASLVALNALIVRPLGRRPHVYHGAIGPVRDAAPRRRRRAALAALVPAFGLRGLASLDFIAVDGTPCAARDQSAPVGQHGAACTCLAGRARCAPTWRRWPAARDAHARAGVRGSRIVFADAPCRLDGRASRGSPDAALPRPACRAGAFARRRTRVQRHRRGG